MIHNIEINTKAIYRRLDKRRKVNDLSWRQLGKLLGMSASTFSRLKEGRAPTAALFARFLVFTKAPLKEFLKR